MSLSSAARLRDTVRRMIRQEIETLRPRPRYATVVSYDRVARTCVVNFPESPTTNITVHMGSVQPSSAGQVVRIEGVSTDRYITDIMGQAYVDSAGSISSGSWESPAVTVTGDWNDVVESGVYKGDNLTNKSPGHGLNWRRVLVIKHDNSYISQVSFSYTDAAGPGTTVYHRAKSDGTWQPWRPLDVGQDAGWINVSTFANGWVNYGGIYPVARYRKLATGIVRLSGLIKNGTLNQHAFILPGGYRPSTDLHMSTISNNAFSRVVVRGDGRVSIDVPGSNVWCSLDGLAMFLAEQ